MTRSVSAILACVCWATQYAVIVRAADAPATRPAPAAAGRVLLGDLNCTACHAATPAQAAWLSPKTAPRLNDIGTRVQPDWLARYLAAPHAVMPGVTMPHLLGGLAEADRPAAAEALAHFLMSVSPPRAKPVLPDRAAVRRGEAIYHKVGCVACHAPQDGKATPQDGRAALAGSVPLPEMSRKWAFEGLCRFLRDPLASRPSGRMPALNLTDGEAADVAHFLLRDTKVPAAVEVAQFRGQIRSLEDLDSAEPARTFPADGFSLDALGRDRGYAVRFTAWLRVETAGEYAFHLTTAGASRLAMNGAWLVGRDSWRRERVEGKAKVRLDAGVHEVTLDFVQRGQKEPSLKLEWEGPDVQREAIPTARLRSTKEPVVEPRTFTVDPGKAARGCSLYAELNCATCHENKPPAKPLAALSAVDPARGCLAEKPASPSPDCRLPSGDAQAIRAALAELHRGDVPPPSPQQRLAHALLSMRCTACHARDGVGGAAADRDPRFTSAGEDLGDEGRLPPRLDGVGDKLRREAIAAVLKGAAVRPYLNTRMPQFGEANVGHLPDLFAALDRKPVPVNPSPDPPDARRDVGRSLVGTDGLSCIACHTFNRQPAQAMQVVDLTTAGERLNEDWFRQFLVDPNRFHPGTRMPSFWPEGRSPLPKLLGGNTDRQHAAVWAYLADGPRAKFPQGLSRQNVELVVGGEAVVYRGKLWEAGYRGIATGFPGGLNAAFDAEEGRLALLWRGRFLNAGPHWGGQGMGQIRPLGADVVVFPRGPALAVLADANAPWPAAPPRELGLRFGGYQLDPQKRPTLTYSLGGKRIEDFTVPLEGDAPVLRRTIAVIDSPADKLYMRIAAGKLAPAGAGAWRMNDAVTITVRGGGTPVVRGAGDRQELIVPIPADEKARRVEVDYAW
jgi:mono/diheme cytochrome c family protein